MVFGRVAFLIGLLLSTSAAADPGQSKRLWVDPPPMTDAQPQEGSTTKQLSFNVPATQATAWSDEASRRPSSVSATAAMKNSAVSPKVRRQLGLLAGFAAPSATEALKAQRATERAALKFDRMHSRKRGALAFFSRF